MEIIVHFRIDAKIKILPYNDKKLNDLCLISMRSVEFLRRFPYVGL